MSAGKKIRIGSIITMVVVICVWFYATPYLTLYQFKKAVDAQDAAAISRHIDFPALRESMKSGLAARKETGGSNPFKSLESTIAGVVTAPMVDALVTPNGIVEIMKGRRLLGSQGRKGQDSQKKDKDDQEYSMGYETFNRFVLKLKNKLLLLIS